MPLYFDPPSGTPIFGADYQEAVDDAETSTSSTTYQDKVYFTTPTLTGTYRIWFSCTLRKSSGSPSYRGKVRLLDNTNTVTLREYYESIAQSSAEDIAIRGFVTLAFAGQSRDLRLQYGSVNGTYTFYIKYARLTLWRIS